MDDLLARGDFAQFARMDSELELCEKLLLEFLATYEVDYKENTFSSSLGREDICEMTFTQLERILTEDNAHLLAARQVSNRHFSIVAAKIWHQLTNLPAIEFSASKSKVTMYLNPVRRIVYR